MNTSVLKRVSLILGLSLTFLGLNVQNSSAQADAKSKYDLGKVKAQKDPIPGEGNLVGSVVMLGKKTKIPLVFVEVEGGKSIQSDTKGKFSLTLEQGTYTIKIDCSGYKQLVIKDLAIKEGSDQYIKIELASIDTGKFK